MKALWKRALALLMAATMTCSVLPATAMAAPEAELLADFTFDDEETGFVGGKAKATGTYTLKDSFDTENGKALYLDGRSQFLTVTDAEGKSLLTGAEEITVSYDAKLDRTASNWAFYAAPNTNRQTYNNEYYIGGLYLSGSSLKIERYLGGRSSCPETAISDWAHVDVVFAKDSTTLYVDGVKKATTDSSNSLSGILGDNSILYIGKANWESGEYYQGWIDNFKIYNAALTDADLVDTDAAAKAVAADKEALSIQTEVTENFRLPRTGAKGSVITWTAETSDAAVIGTNGYSVTVKRSSTENVTVKFTATLTMGSATDTKTFDVVVKREATDADVVADAIKKLEIVNADEVKGNISLPASIEVEGTDKVATVTWKSGNAAVVTDKEVDGKAAGVVTRQAKDTKVTMTATVACGSASKEVKIDLNVAAAPKNLDDDYTAGYMWAHFGTEGGYEKMFFGFSEDGLRWEKLNKKNNVAQPVLANDAPGSDLGVRDPHFIRSAEGDRYWIIGTDLHAEGGGAGGSGWNQTSASKNIVVWESDDLVNWSEPKLVFAGLDTAGCVWAPEAIYDETAGDYMVYWAARDTARTGNDNALRMYLCRTRDFVNFTEPQVWLSEDKATGGEVNIIDVTIAKGDDGRYYRFATSDWNTVLDVSDTLSEDVFDVRENADTSINGDWTRLIKRGGHSAAGFSNVEGFTVYQLPDGRWCAMGDNGGYKAFVTDDLASAQFTSVSASFPDGRFRHGTVMRLSAAEEARVLAAYGDGAPVPTPTPDPEPTPTPDPSGRKVLAQFTFDDEETGFVSENAKATGNHSLADSYAADAGKALSLNGGSNNFLSVTDKDGGSLLTGVTQMTVSFEAKPANTNTNWPLYASPSTASPNYNVSEHYLGFLMNGGALTIERFNQNNSGRPSSASATIGSNTWVRVDVVLTENNTKLYINGKLESEVRSSYKLDELLGNASILQIGKANWGNGEYYNGLIDNMTIVNYAMTDAEVQEASAAFTSLLPAMAGATVGTAPSRQQANGYRGTDLHTAITTLVDDKEKTLTPYVRNCAGADVTKLPVTFELNTEAVITVDGKEFENGKELDLSKDVTVVLKKASGAEETWTLKAAVLSNNPVLPGQYADPDIDYFDGKFWIFPTTDGYSGWSGHLFHAWSSEDMVNWTDEGVILDLKENEPYENEQGIMVATSDWATGSAWAPSIEEKDGKYYFYYCGKFTNGESAIGVAVADEPQGPYTDKGEALMTVSMCRSAGVSMGQAIDPSIFTDEDGTSYLLFGNGNAAIAELNDDMMSIKEGTLKQINGLRDFRESVVVMKVDGKYHWTWSCDDTGSPNYHVNYGVTDNLTDRVTFVKTLLQKDDSKNMLGTAHQSMVHVQDVDGNDRYFIAYHRFYTPLEIYTSGLGYHRETCIDEVFFGEDGYMTAAPTLEGMEPVYTTDAPKPTPTPVVTPTPTPDPTPTPTPDPTPTPAPGLPYVDVAETDWFYDAVAYTYYEEVMTGMDPTHFGPYGQLSRAQFALILYRIEGEPEFTTEKAFADIAGDEWYGKAVLWAAEAGIVSGYQNGSFGPADNITREQMAVMMYRYAKYLKEDVTTDADYSEFKDAASVSEFATDAIKWAVGNGIITGKENGTMIDPQGNTARAEAAAIIQRFMK